MRRSARCWSRRRAQVDLELAANPGEASDWPASRTAAHNGSSTVRSLCGRASRGRERTHGPRARIRVRGSGRLQQEIQAVGPAAAQAKAGRTAADDDGAEAREGASAVHTPELRPCWRARVCARDFPRRANLAGDRVGVYIDVLVARSAAQPRIALNMPLDQNQLGLSAAPTASSRRRRRPTATTPTRRHATRSPACASKPPRAGCSARPRSARRRCSAC